MSEEVVEFQVFHGTDFSNFESLKKTNFRKSEGESHEKYLGDGAYFFSRGVPPEPIISAEKWAVVSAWDYETRNYKYRKYCVIKAVVRVEKTKFLDLCSWDGIEIFNYLRDSYIKKLFDARRSLQHGEFKDGHIVNTALKEIGIEVDLVRGNFYFKFKNERIVNAQFKTPNCTIVAVRNLNCIDKNSIEICKTNSVR